MGKQYLKRDAVRRVYRFTDYKKKTPPSRILPEPLYEDSNKFYKSEIIFSPRAHKFYRQHTKYKKPLSKNKLFFVMKECLKIIKQRMIHNESGVFIKNFGYFCMMRHPERKIRNFHIKGYYIKGRYLETKGCMFSPVFLPIRKDSTMQQWTMDKAFSKKITASMAYYLRSKNKKYRMSFTILNNLYGRENSKIEPPIKR